jgi:hypothetical protein
MPLDGGGAIPLEEVEGAAEFDVPVKAGPVGEAVRELPRTLNESLVPVHETARAVLDQLRQAGPRDAGRGPRGCVRDVVPGACPHAWRFFARRQRARTDCHSASSTK